MAEVENDQYRVYGSALETLDHLISACKMMMSVQYMDRHNTVCIRIVHTSTWLTIEPRPVYLFEQQAVLDSSAYEKF